MRRTFRNVAIIAGLIERNSPGQEKSKRQITVNSDLIYNVLRRYEADHILLRATRRDAQTNLIDYSRLQSLLVRIKGRIRHVRLDRVSPLAVPAMLEIGREAVYATPLTTCSRRPSAFWLPRQPARWHTEDVGFMIYSTRPTPPAQPPDENTLGVLRIDRRAQDPPLWEG